MASYAAVAAKGPHQSPEEPCTNSSCFASRAPPLPELERTDDSTHSLIDVDSPHVSSVPSDFESQSVKTDTQAERLAHEEEDRRVAEEQRQKKERHEHAKKQKEKAKAKAHNAEEYARNNANNPVLLGNSVVIVALGAVLGYGAYRKYKVGELNWQTVGIGAGIVGLFATADYYLSKYLFRKYPTK